MKIIIFAGGTGKRFWPASRKNSPKQFLPVVGDTPLLKLRYDLMLKGFRAEDIYISSGQRYEQEIKTMLPQIPAQNLILEPEMRDTGPAVALAVSYINHKFPGEVVSIQWSDHIIKDSDKFIQTLKDAEGVAARQGQAVFITVPARFASPHRGYIKFGKELDAKSGLREFVQFVEKPDEQTAQGYIDSGEYGWNPGYWVAPAEFILSKMASQNPGLVQVVTDIAESDFSQSELAKFSSLEKISADYIFAELVQPSEAKVLLIDMGWSDVGEWIGLHEALADSSTDNISKGSQVDIGSEGSVLYNYESGKLLATVGLKDMVVVNTKDAILVVPKSDNARLKQLLDKLEKEGHSQFL